MNCVNVCSVVFVCNSDGTESAGQLYIKGEGL